MWMQARVAAQLLGLQTDHNSRVCVVAVKMSTMHHLLVVLQGAGGGD
jgi:hypothetical protein